MPKAGSAVLGGDAMLKLVREFQNAVERNQWRSAAFTADSEHLAAAAHSKTEHIIYIWNREWGNLTCILEGGGPNCLWRYMVGESSSGSLSSVQYLDSAGMQHEDPPPMA